MPVYCRHKYTESGIKIISIKFSQLGIMTKDMQTKFITCTV